MRRALFICSQNRLRSPTAEQIFASWPDVETDSVGLGADATVPLSTEQIEWSMSLPLLKSIQSIPVMNWCAVVKAAKKFRLGAP